MSNDIQINQVLQQMRAMAAQAGTQPERAGAVPGAGEGQVDFAALLKQSIDSVNQTQQTAGAMTRAFERGDPNVDLAEVMVSMQKASLSFEAMKQVRNQLLKAYQDIMNMPV